MKSSIVVGIICLLLFVSSCYSQDSSRVDSTLIKKPGKALLYSILPGGGQVYNQRYVKATLFAGVFVYYGIKYVDAKQDYKANPTDEALHRARNDKIWMMGLTWTLSLVDAYVDSQLWDFDEYKMSDDDSIETEIIKPKETEISDDTE